MHCFTVLKAGSPKSRLCSIFFLSFCFKPLSLSPGWLSSLCFSSNHLPSMCLSVFKFPYFMRHELYWTSPHPNDHTWWSLERPCHQKMSHSEVLGLGIEPMNSSGDIIQLITVSKFSETPYILLLLPCIKNMWEQSCSVELSVMRKIFLPKLLKIVVTEPHGSIEH